MFLCPQFWKLCGILLCSGQQETAVLVVLTNFCDANLCIAEFLRGWTSPMSGQLRILKGAMNTKQKFVSLKTLLCDKIILIAIGTNCKQIDINGNVKPLRFRLPLSHSSAIFCDVAAFCLCHRFEPPPRNVTGLLVGPPVPVGCIAWMVCF